MGVAMADFNHASGTCHPMRRRCETSHSIQLAV